MDNYLRRYSPWISTGRFGRSVIHSNSPVDDVDIHRRIYRPVEGVGTFGALSKIRRHAQFIKRPQYIFATSPNLPRKGLLVWQQGLGSFSRRLFSAPVSLSRKAHQQGPLTRD